jgi:anti-sigma regulatory factor (Ser/Thr protein kinase)
VGNAAPLEVDAVLDLVLSSAARLFQGEGGSIMLLVDDEELEVVASPANPAALGARVRFGEGVSGKVAESLEPVLISGRVGNRTTVVDSAICFPLLHDGALFGVLNINARPVHIFSNHDLTAGTAFGAYAADALIEARQYEVDRQQGDPAPERHLAAMLKHLQAAASVDFVGPAGADEVDLAAIARSVAAAEDGAGRPTSVRGTCDGFVTGSGKQVRRVLQELVDNGHRHGSPPVRIVFEPPDARGDIELVVTDAGPGVPEDDRAQIFEPYGRLERATDGPGLGLGLAIVRRIVDAMGGTVSMGDDTVGGAAVTLRLPRALPGR